MSAGCTALKLDAKMAGYLEEFQDAKLDLLVLVLLLLRLGVGLLLTLLGSSHEAGKDVEGVLICHTRPCQHTAVLQLPSSEEDALCLYGQACRRRKAQQTSRPCHYSHTLPQSE